MISYIRKILFPENAKNYFKRLPGAVNNKGIKWIPYIFFRYHFFDTPQRDSKKHRRKD